MYSLTTAILNGNSHNSTEHYYLAMASALDDRKYNILLVEDDPINITVVSGVLSEQYQLYIAKTRQKAFQILEKTRIDLVLLDLHLPDGDGFEICEELIDNNRGYGYMHIVFMTGMDNPEYEAKGIRLGAHDYITKPVSNTVLKARVDLQIKFIRQTELLSRHARIDSTTELNNRRAFDDRLQEEWNRAMRDSCDVSLCLLDLDFFKQYNDTYGHPAGDDCLRTLAKCLSNRFRRASDFIARYGGEEFAVIFYKTSAPMAASLMEKALQDLLDLSIPHSGSKQLGKVSFSAGVAGIRPERGKQAQTLLDIADEELYNAKKAGKAQVMHRTC